MAPIFGRSKILKTIGSLKITVVCLALLIVLTIWGTLYQVDHGIIGAKGRFITSWVFFLGNIIPLPGGNLVMTTFFVNQVASLLCRFSFRWSRLGLWTLHLGVVVLCVGSFWTYKWSTESSLTLTEGQESGYSKSDTEWEFAATEVKDGKRIVNTLILDGWKSGQKKRFEELGIDFELEVFYRNCRPGVAEVPTDYINIQGISKLERSEEEAHPGRNFPGGVFVFTNGDQKMRVMLVGEEQIATTIPIGDRSISLSLRRRYHRLPAKFKLLDVMRELHPGTQIAKRYESHVQITVDGVTREARIFMNHPLQLEGFTFFQSGYNQMMDGREVTTFAVAQNSAKYVPYVASFMMGIGLIIHFVGLLFKKSPKKKEEAK